MRCFVTGICSLSRISSSLFLELATHPHIGARLPLVLLHRQPLQVFHPVGTASAQRFYVVNLPAWAREFVQAS